MKYIDTERLNTEIEKLYDGEAPKHDPQCDFDDGYFTGISRVFDVIDSLQQEQQEQPVPNNLEEAADKYKKQVIEETKCHHNALTYAEGYEDALLLIPDAFIDGAKWQKEQDDRLVDIIYQQGVEKGKDDMKEQMLKDAVEGIVMNFSSNKPQPTVIVDAKGFNQGDRVRIIIVKEEN